MRARIGTRIFGPYEPHDALVLQLRLLMSINRFSEIQRETRATVQLRQ